MRALVGAGLLTSERVCRQNLEAQHTDHLPGFGDHAHLPAAFGGRGEVELVRPGPVALLATATDVQGDAIDLVAIVLPDVIDALVKTARGIDRGIGVEAIVA